MKRAIAAILAATGAALAAAVPVHGEEIALAMLGRLEAGAWELRVRDEAGSVERLCLRTGAELIQLRHRGATCRQVVVNDMPAVVTVQYTCPGQGYGRTQIRRETDRLVQIDSQGIFKGSPFAFAAEARRVGRCP